MAVSEIRYFRTSVGPISLFLHYPELFCVEYLVDC